MIVVPIGIKNATFNEEETKKLYLLIKGYCENATAVSEVDPQLYAIYKQLKATYETE